MEQNRMLRLLVSFLLSGLVAFLIGDSTMHSTMMVDARRYRRATTTTANNSFASSNNSSNPMESGSKGAQQCSANRDYPRGAILTLHCPEGYELVGNSMTTCGDNSRWRGGSLGYCRKVIVKAGCVAPDTPPNAFIINHAGLMNDTDNGREFRFEEGGFIRYSCNFCYKLKGFGSIRCRGDGSWSGEVPTCVLGYHFIDDRIARC